jgi:hypothetical protein
MFLVVVRTIFLITDNFALPAIFPFTPALESIVVTNVLYKKNERNTSSAIIETTAAPLMILTRVLTLVRTL